MISLPRIVIAGTHSGCGKTTIASGIMAALVKRGLAVQPFKVGPDFIDPSHHAKICGRASRNLDPFMMGEAGCTGTFTRAAAGADIAVIEGVMGMYDGIDGSGRASTAHVARILKAPVILVVDAKGMSRSAHAVVDGFRRFDPAIRIAGVIFNRVGSTRHRSMIGRSPVLPALGFVPRTESLTVKSRHLGLAMAHETENMGSFGPVIEEFCDLDGIVAAAEKAPPLENPHPAQISRGRPGITIGVAYDEAFCFYYQDNLDLLASRGANLALFSPIHDTLPEVDALYIGGGYPELHLPALESSPCSARIRRCSDDGMPVYAECGGLMYLARDVSDGRTFRMCGVLPASAGMTARVQALGYVKGTGTGTGSFIPAGRKITGHEFHYSRLDPDPDARFAVTLTRGKGIRDGMDGLFSHNTVGCYTHAYFTRAFAQGLISAAARYARR